MKSFFSMIMVVLCLFGLTINNTFAQTGSTPVEKQMVVVRMENGEVLRADDQKMVLASENGEINLFIAQIDELEVKDIDENDSNRSRYFLTSSAIPVEKGKGYYTNHLLFLNRVRFGITNNHSMEAGFFFLSIGRRNIDGISCSSSQF